ncbi:hypothetical protein ACPV5Q_20235 [Vibrio astriarenae]
MYELFARTAIFSMMLTLLIYFFGVYSDGVLLMHTLQEPGYRMPNQASFWGDISSTAKHIPKTVFITMITLFVLYVIEVFMAIFIFNITAAAICNFLIGPLFLICLIDFPFEIAPGMYGLIYGFLVLLIGVGRLCFREL